MNDKGKPASVTQHAGKEAVSRGELEALRARQRKPNFMPELTPPGYSGQARIMEDNRQIQKANYIENRLAREDGHAGKDFSRAKAKGKARQDFDQSR